MKKTLTFLLVLSVCFIILAFATNTPPPFNEWRKGPPIHTFSAYSSGNAERIFWISNIFFLDTYFLIIMLLTYIIKRRRAPLSQWSHFIIAIIIFMGTLLSAEYGMRLYIKTSAGYTQFRPHPLLYWWNRPNLNNFTDMTDGTPKTTNSYGFRYGEEIARKKDTNEYRIFILGDSSAFGSGVENEEVFSAQMEKKMSNNPKYQIRVINAACPGHTTYQGLIILKQMLLPLHPDMVIISYNNDPTLEYIEEKKRKYQNQLVEKISIILYKSDYYLLLQRVLNDYKILFLTWIKKEHAPALVQRISLQDYKNNVEEFIKIGKQNDIRMLFVRMPVNYRTFEIIPLFKTLYYDARYPKTLVELCKENKQILVNVDEEWGKNNVTNLFQDMIYEGIETKAHFHPNAKGHRKIAEQICDTIEQNRLLY